MFFRGLWFKFFVLLMSVVTIALTSSFVIRHLMLQDFRQYEEGQLEDRVYWVMADLESSYEKNSAWSRQDAEGDAVLALMMGLRVRLFDSHRVLVTDTDQALENLHPVIKKKVLAVSGMMTKRRSGRLLPYPLFLNGREIGSLEVRFLRPEREAVFVRRSDLFRLFSVIALGGIAFVLSILFSKRLTDPLERLAAAAQGIIEGDLSGRVKVKGHDEVARLSDTFNRVAKFLETQEALRKKLLGNISHEIRTPLTAIRGELAGMIDGLLPADKQQFQSLYDETCRLENLLDGIEELSRAQAGAVFLHRDTLNAWQMLENVKNMFSGVCLDKGASLEIHCSRDMDIYADPERLKQIIVNLVSNALKAVESGGKVSVQVSKGGGEACVEVQDNGCGIGGEDLPFIFDRFYRTSEGGIGIGLAVVKELVDAHEGRIEVKSEKGAGTLFKVFIPQGL